MKSEEGWRFNPEVANAEMRNRFRDNVHYIHVNKTLFPAAGVAI
jgi:hypothetical protein